MRFESLTGTPLRLYVLADPAPGNDGNDDRGVSAKSELIAYDDVAATAVAASPALRRTTSGYRRQLVPRARAVRREVADPSDRAELAGGRGPHELAVSTPSGTSWHRFTFDGYGEQYDGGDWDLFFDNPARQTRGRLWPLLTGERGECELLAGRDARSHLRTIANTANGGLMLPEQVWDDVPPPGELPGRGTRSATPLAWTHAQFVRLAWSIDAGEPIERPSIVACRYTGTDG